MPHVEISCYPGRTEEMKQKCAEKIAEEAGAIRKFGRILRYYRPAIDAYLANAGIKEG